MSFLVLVLSQYLRFLHASCLALQAYSLRFLLTLSVLDISKAPGFQSFSVIEFIAVIPTIITQPRETLRDF